MKRHILGATTIALGCAWGGQTMVAAQVPSAAEALAAFEASASVGLPPDEFPDAHWVVRAMSGSDQISRARADSILDGLARIAIESPTQQARFHAIVSLASAGDELPPINTGIVERLRSVYRSSQDITVRGFAAQIMPRQQERPEALAFLESVAADDSPLDRLNDEPASLYAVQALTHMGVEGGSVLRRLHESGAVGNARARGRLEAIARDGFQVTPN